MRRTLLLLGSLSILAVGAWASWVHWTDNRDWRQVEKTIGFPGQVEGDGFKVWIPRWDLNVLVHGLSVAPSAGLSSWFAFKPLTHGSLLVGDLVVVDGEGPKVEAQLASQGLTLTSLYRPFQGETPGVERIRFRAQGARVALAEKVRALLAATGMSLNQPPPESKAPSNFQALGVPLQKVLGEGVWGSNSLSFTYALNAPVTVDGLDVPSYMGLQTRLVFQPDGKQMKAYGHFVVRQDQAASVINAFLNEHIPLTATHSEWIEEKPALVEIDSWVEGDGADLADRYNHVLLKAGLTPLAASKPTEKAQGQTQK